MTMRFSKRHHRGSTLIEVLISVLLMSLSLLGLSKLMGVSYAYSKSAQTSLIANGLVSNLVEKARVNLLGFDNGLYKIENMESESVASSPATLKVEDSAAYVAALDRAKIKTLIKNSLPQGQVKVSTGVVGFRRQMEIWIYWSAPGSSLTAALSSLNSGNCPQATSSAASETTTCMYFKEYL